MRVLIRPKFIATGGPHQIKECIVKDGVAMVELPDNHLVATIEDLEQVGHSKGVDQLAMDAFTGPTFQVGYLNGGLLWLQVQDGKVTIKYYGESPEDVPLLEKEVAVPQLSVDKEGGEDGEKGRK